MPQLTGSVDLIGITILQVPGAQTTTVTGINNNGQVVGYFMDENAFCHGFMYQDQTYSQPVDYPGIIQTYIYGINDFNQVVGKHSEVSDAGFLYSKGTFSPSFSIPGSERTMPADINVYGEIVGSFYDQKGKKHGFLYNAGEFYLLDGPSNGESFASAINDGGQIVGGVSDGTGINGFVYLESAGVYSELLQFPESPSMYPNGINNRGEIVGNFRDEKNNPQPFISFAASCHQIRIPGAISAGANDINDHGQVVGNFKDRSGDHAYLGVVLT